MYMHINATASYVAPTSSRYLIMYISKICIVLIVYTDA